MGHGLSRWSPSGHSWAPGVSVGLGDLRWGQDSCIGHQGSGAHGLQGLGGGGLAWSWGAPLHLPSRLRQLDISRGWCQGPEAMWQRVELGQWL